MNTDLGVPFDRTPGELNAITDVKSVEVGHTTLISGEGPLKVGVGPVRTGVTAVFPRGKDSSDPVFGAVYRKRKRRNYGDHLGGEVGFSRRTSHDNVLARRMVLQTPCNHVYIVEIAVPGFGNHGESPRVSDIAFLHYSRTRGVKGVEDVVRPDMKAEYP